MQRKFRFGALLAGAALFAAVVAGDRHFDSLPDREAAPPAVAALQLDPIQLSAAEMAPLVPVGAWRLRSLEPRFGGISGLAIDGGDLVALTDAGAFIRFSKSLRAQMQLHVADLPSGPGDERFKFNRDSEAILRDPQGRGWWVAFENRDELWLFDLAFERALGRVALAPGLLSENTGIEGLAGGRYGVLAFPESGGSALRSTRAGWAQAPLDRHTPVADAVQVDHNLIFLVERRLTPGGFDNALALVDADGPALATLWRKRLPVGRRDNVEAVAAERIAGGGYRLWLMSDDNFHPRLRTLLLVIDVPAKVLPKRR